MSTNEISLENLGFSSSKVFHRNLTTEELVEQSIADQKNKLGSRGILLISTEQYPERRPEDKYYSDDPETSEDIWWDIVNTRIKPDTFTVLKTGVVSDIKDRTKRAIS